jgi:phage terminase large subunit|nr:MAG TPA: terminase large subunit [Caudoviricetes sp.]
MVINYKKLNPNGFYLLKYLNDETIRFIILYGGSSSGKSYSVAQTILIQTLQDGENTLVMRKVGASILKTIYEDYKVAAAGLGISHLFKFQQNTIKCLVNGAKIDFSGLDDPEKIKGISNYKRVQLEEWSEFEHPDFKQLRKRLRGKKGQQIICTFNPISESHWIKKEFIDKDKWHDVPMTVTIAGKELPKELTKVKSVKKNAPRQILNLRTKQIEEQAPNTVIIQSTYLNNFWVVGSPDGTYGFYDEQCVADFEYDRVHDPDYYNVYALGEWGVIRTGSEFFGSFNRGKHSGEHKYIPDLPIHISVDNNVLPYISVSYWQVDFTTGIKVWQFHETCAESPNNTVKKSSKLVAKYLKDIRYSDKVYLHGDASTKAANSIDDEKRSWMDLFIDTLQKEGFEIEDKVGNKNPSVAMTGEFINAIFDCTVPGIEIYIDESCSVSIEDYMSVQKDANGAILKTKVKNKTTLQTYEEHGHLCFTSDTLVSTTHGDIPISEIKKGDKVIIENGESDVYNSLCTSRKSRYFLLTLCDNIIKCTIDHPVYTQRGFIPVCELKVGDEIIVKENEKVWKKKLSNITVLDLFVTQIVNVKAIASTLRDGLRKMENGEKKAFIGICGYVSVAKYLKTIVFTILMVITTIIQLITLLLCLPLNMKNFIQTIIRNISGRKLKRGWITTETKQQNGISLTQDVNGTQRKRKGRWKIGSIENMFVKFVGKYIRRAVSELQNFVLTIAKANGVDYREWTMKNVFVQFVGLNLLTINILRRSFVHGNVLLRIGGIADLYDISTVSHRFFANGVLVHNCDTFRYVVVDLCSEQYIEFSNRRKRNLYACNGTINFFNPDTECKYTKKILYVMPNVNGKFVLIQAFRCGNKWHVVDVVFMDTTSTEDIRSSILSHESDSCVIECTDAYFPFIRELRSSTNKEIRVMKEFPDVDKRIAATSDYVKNSILFSASKVESDTEYVAFMNNLMDYNKDSETKEASAVLSGLVQFVVKLGLN